MRHPAQWKTDLVKTTSKEIDQSETIAIVDIHGLRNNQFQSIRRDVRKDLKIQVMRGTLLRKAIEKSKKPDIAKILPEVSGQIALVTSSADPGTIYRTFNEKREKMSPRGGEIADEDIVVPEGETNFPPGPMISEFQKAGLQAAIEKGKIVIKKDSVLVKKGEIITKEKASVLQKLEIRPIEVGLNLKAAYSSGILFRRDVLSITPEVVSAQVVQSFNQAKLLALDIGFLVPEIIPDLIVKGRLVAESLAVRAGIVDESNIQLFILKAITEATSLKEATESKEESTSEAKEEKTEEKKGDSDEDISAGLGALFG